MKNILNTKTIVTTGLLLAIEIIFQVMSNYIQLGPVSVNLSLVAIVLAAVLCGPVSGAILGFFNGLIVILSPSTMAIFMPISLGGTIVTCLLKSTLAGLASGFIYKLFKEKHPILGIVLASIAVPVVNTGLFTIFSLLFFRPFLESGVSSTFPNIGAFLIFGVIGWNFIIEIITTVELGTAVGIFFIKKKQNNE